MPGFIYFHRHFFPFIGLAAGGVVVGAGPAGSGGGGEPGTRWRCQGTRSMDTLCRTRRNQGKLTSARLLLRACLLLYGLCVRACLLADVWGVRACLVLGCMSELCC
jgi:hypothetical protein